MRYIHQALFGEQFLMVKSMGSTRPMDRHSVVLIDSNCRSSRRQWQFRGNVNRTLSELGLTDSMEDTLQPSAQREPLSRTRQTILVSILLLGLLFSSLDASIVGTSLVTISVELQDYRNSPWVALSYLLAYMGFAVLFAKLSDIYGRRTLLAVAWILFTAFSLGCGLAANMPSLIIFRAIQGVGGSGLYSLAQVCLFEVGPSNKPSLLGALVGMTLAVSFVLGPVLGGTITRFATWSWIFYINIPFGILALLGLAFAWPPNKSSDPLGLWEVSRKFNICGNTLMISASGLLVYALQEAGSFNYAWSSPAIIATLSVAAVSWLLFIGRELFLVRRCNRYIDPVFPTRLIIQRPFLSALSCSFLAGFTYLALIIILPERFQIVNGDDSLMAGVHLLPQLGACAFGSFLAGAVSSKRNNTAITLIVAHCLQLIGIGLLSTLSDVHTAIEAQYGYQAIFGLGVGLSFASVTILTSVRAHPEEMAVAQGAIAQARVFGGALGITVCSLGDELGSSDMSALQRDPVTISYFLPDIQALVRKTYAGAFTDDIKVMIGVTAVGLLVSLFSFEVDPPLMPGHQAPKEDVLV